MRNVLSLSLSNETVNIINQAKLKALKEQKIFNLSQFLVPVIEEACKEYVHDHGDGNPAYTMNQFIENPELLAAPAFYSHIDRWQKYIHAVYKTPQWTRFKEQQKMLNEEKTQSRTGGYHTWLTRKQYLKSEMISLQI